MDTNKFILVGLCYTKLNYKTRVFNTFVCINGKEYRVENGFLLRLVRYGVYKYNNRHFIMDYTKKVNSDAINKLIIEYISGLDVIECSKYLACSREITYREFARATTITRGSYGGGLNGTYEYSDDEKKLIDEYNKCVIKNQYLNFNSSKENMVEIKINN